MKISTPDPSLGCPNRGEQLPLLHRAVSLIHAWGVSGGPLWAHPTRFQTSLTENRKAASEEASSPLNSLLPSDFFLSVPVSKPADCDSLIGVRKAGWGEAGGVTGIVEGDSPEMSEENRDRQA